MNINKNIPLCCDLDETLIKTDCFFEAISYLIKTNPLYILYFPIWAIKGLPNFKQEVFKRAKIDVKTLPYNYEVIDFLKEQKANGHKIVLATATPQFIADEVEEYLGIFDKVLGSTDKLNLKSHNKANKLVELYGENGFDYIGDSLADINVWKRADKAYLVAKSDYSVNKILKSISVEKIIYKYDNYAGLLIKELRILQWIKNLILIIPLILAHKIADVDLLFNSTIAFFSFSFVASAVYILNDLSDLTSDRQHRSKKYRPFASGHLRLQYAFVLVPTLLIVSFVLSFLFLNINFSIILLFYFVITSLYSLYIKKIAILDILILASLYAIRIFAGGIATNIYLSPWLIGFTLFMFLSLAIVKRFTELNYLKMENIQKTIGRGYTVDDISLLRTMGISSGFLSIMVLVLYLNSEEVKVLYSTPSLLWALAPLLLYWVMNLWLIAERGKMTDDPVVFAAKDKSSYIVSLLIAFIIYLAV
ncbi:MAG: UbiA family prenyltransferase [Candidatus Kapaibacteriota bacterium]